MLEQCELGNLFLKANRYQEAIEAFNHAVRLDPTDASAHHHLGLSYLASGDKDSALAKHGLLDNLYKDAGDEVSRDVYKHMADDLISRIYVD